jgi:hypothetical protein
MLEVRALRAELFEWTRRRRAPALQTEIRLSCALRHLNFVIPSSFLLLVTQCFDRIQGGGFARRIKTEEDADGGAKKERYDDRAD